MLSITLLPTEDLFTYYSEVTELIAKSMVIFDIE
jgi:hypothetical protein